MYLMTGDAFSATSDTALYKLGERRLELHRTFGTREWRYIQNKSGGALSQGLGVMQEASLDHGQVTLSGAATPRVRFLGVANHDIADNYFGWVLADTAGAEFKASATGIVANDALMCVANGLFEAGTIGTNEIVGFAQEAAAAGALATGIVRS